MAFLCQQMGYTEVYSYTIVPLKYWLSTVDFALKIFKAKFWSKCRKNFLRTCILFAWIGQFLCMPAR